jgi:rhamnose transport system ATP-binding protein
MPAALLARRSEVVLAGRALSKSFGGVPVLRDVDLAVQSGEVRALLGENGAGKSTLIKILTGAIAPDAGELQLGGRRMPFGQALYYRDAGISAVYQEFTLIPDLTVAENVFLGRELGPVLLDRAGMQRRAARIFEELGVSIDAGARVRGLSVAHQQFVEIARALACDARIVIFDEPTAALPAPEVERFLAVVRRLRDRGIGVLYTSHRLEEVFAIADTVTILRDGQVVAAAPVAGMTRGDVIRWMVGRDVSEEFPVRQPHPGEIVFEADRLSMQPRVRDVTLQVRRGEIVALAGLVGAGRTAAALGFVGALQPVSARSGQMRLDGRPVTFASPAEALDHGVAYVTEDRKSRGIFPVMSAEANITMARIAEFTRRGWLSRTRERTAAERIGRECRVRAPTLQQSISTLSGGNQQKALLARYLVTPPRLLIVDEPTRGVDVGARAEIYLLLDRLSRDGMAILMISSDLTEVLGMADRVVVMRNGRTTRELVRGEATAERVMSLATLES